MLKKIKKTRLKIEKLNNEIADLENKRREKEAKVSKLTEKNLKLCPHENIEDTGGMQASILECKDCGNIIGHSM